MTAPAREGQTYTGESLFVRYVNFEIVRSYARGVTFDDSATPDNFGDVHSSVRHRESACLNPREIKEI